MYDDVRRVTEDFWHSGDIDALLAAKLPPPQRCPRRLRPMLAQVHQLRFQAQGGFAGLVEREIAAVLFDRSGDPAVARVTALPEYRSLEAARKEYGEHRDRASSARHADAHMRLMNAVDDERLKAAIAADYATALSTLDELSATGRNRQLVLDLLNWTIARTPHDDPQRARRLLARARAKSAAGARPLQVLADCRAAARLALRERPVWRDVVLALARFEADLYSQGAPLIHLAGALVACRDLAEAVRRDFGEKAEVPVLRELEEEATLRLGAETTRWLMTCHRDPAALARQYDVIALLRKVPIRSGVLEKRRDQAWVLATGLPLNHPDRTAALLDLTYAHSNLWEIGGDPDSAARAHDTAAEALLTASPGDPLRGRLLVAFSHSGMTLAKQTHDTDLAGEAVAAGRAALGLADDDPGERALRQSELAYALITQYELGGNPAAAGEAAALAAEAVALTGADDPDLPVRWAVLCTAAKAAATAGEPGLLAKAVEAGRRAVETLPAGDARRPVMLYNYADTVKTQAVTAETNEPRLFDEAERALRTALSLLEPGHRDHTRFGSALADVLYHRYRQCGDFGALEDSLGHAQKSVRGTAPNHPLYPARALTLARSARELARTGGPRADELRKLAISHYRAVGTHPLADPEQRMTAEQAQAALLAEADTASWLDAQERVIAVIPEFVSRALPSHYRLEAVRGLDGLADRVVDAGVRSGQVDRALELLERCRAVLFGDAWGVRRCWTLLRETAPEPARRLSDVERLLAHNDLYANVTIRISDPEDPASAVHSDQRPRTLEQIRRLAKQRDRLLAEVRDLSGMQDLLSPPDVHTLRGRLAGHTAVVVSVAGSALVVPPDPAQPLQVVPMPGMSEAAARDRVRQLRTALADAKDLACSFDRREQAQREVHAVLEWLWDTTAAPVLDRVTASRLWWCPLGVVSQLPLHAAGRHRERSGRTVFDRVVSSYTPSLTALADVLTTPRPRHADPTALVVGVGEAKGHPTLPNAGAEATAVARLLRDATVLIDTDAEREAIKKGLLQHEIAHFACHGRAVSSTEHPDLGGLLLSKGMITPSFVHDLRTTRAQLAFLSACDTAGADPELLDEPLNLASAFHLAGFRGVIGTLWQTGDNTKTAEAFYTALTEGSSQPVDLAEAATALNETLRRMRDAYPAVPTRWAAHVHVGD
ncbi:CHAT domain-containing protein [Streptomyces sp. NPDC096205]|uniref:CHAT domain-containing protein n=1 Tax=Streptomyces sp. NPDC096205 TaxID=3366081 RepID=UPI0037FDC2CC